MGELFGKSYPTPLQKLPNKITKIDSSVLQRTVDASVPLAFALASGKAPPRPYPLRELFTYGNEIERSSPL